MIRIVKSKIRTKNLFTITEQSPRFNIIKSCTTPVSTGLVRSNSGNLETLILLTSKASIKNNLWEGRIKKAGSKVLALLSIIVMIK